MSPTLHVPSGHALTLLPAGEGVALVMRDPQRWPLASCSASPWVWGGCALWEGKVETLDGYKSKDTTAKQRWEWAR